MADAVTNCVLQQDGVVDLTLPRAALENDVLNPVAYSEFLSAKARHGRREKQVVVLSVLIQRLSNLIERFHPDHVTWPQM